MGNGNSTAFAACQRIIYMVERSLVLEKQQFAQRADTLHVPLIAYALATLQQRIAPALTKDWPADPPHVVVFGGTNSGKSTVLNLLLGQPVAGMNFLARYTQHPSAFSPDSLGDDFLANYPTRFPNYQRYDGQQPPRQSDQQLRQGYQSALSFHTLQAQPALSPPVSTKAIFWDAPDYSTEEASFYMNAVLATVATADLVIMVVTNENYAGHRDMLLRGLILSSGVPTRVVANKLQDGSPLLDDIKMKVCEGENQPLLPAERVHALPMISGTDSMEERLQRLLATPEAQALRKLVATDMAAGAVTKNEALSGALVFLDECLDEILAPLRREVQVMKLWRRAVDDATEQHLYQYYRQHYLASQRYSDFNLSFLKFLNLMELPGIGNALAWTTRSMRTISKFIIGGIGKFVFGKKPPAMPEEQAILEKGCERWVASLKTFAQQQAEQDNHSEWRRLAQTMDQASFLQEMSENMYEAWLEYRQAMDELTQQRANALYEYVCTRPVLHRSLQGAKFATDATALGLAISTGGIDPTDLLLGPAVLALLRGAIEVVGEQFVENQKRVLKEEQYSAIQRIFEQHMVKPTRKLFKAEVSAKDLKGVRSDLMTVRQAIQGCL